MQSKTLHIVKSVKFQTFIMVVIALNSVVIGLETMSLPGSVRAGLAAFDAVCLFIYVVEMVLKLHAYRGAFFKDAWNNFDLIIVLLCLVPTAVLPIPVQVVRVFRIARVFRVFRLVSAFRQMRIIVEAMGRSLPGVFWTAALLSIVYYVFAVIGTSLFGQTFPQWFGNLGASLYTLFQVMTLESWSMGISRPVMEVYPWAWAYFVPFVIMSAFVIVNVVVGIIVSTIDEAHRSVRIEDARASGDLLVEELERLKDHLEKVELLVEAERDKKE